MVLTGDPDPDMERAFARACRLGTGAGSSLLRRGPFGNGGGTEPRGGPLRPASRAEVSAWLNPDLLFGPSGDLFWAARTPIRRAEIRVLTTALDFIEAMSGATEAIPGPPSGGPLHVAALGGFTDRYLVVLFEHTDENVGAEARVATIRDEVDRWAAADPDRMELIKGSPSGSQI